MYDGLRASPPSRTGTSMMTDFQAWLDVSGELWLSDRSHRCTTSSLYTRVQRRMEETEEIISKEKYNERKQREQSQGEIIKLIPHLYNPEPHTQPGCWSQELYPPPSWNKEREKKTFFTPVNALLNLNMSIISETSKALRLFHYGVLTVICVPLQRDRTSHQPSSLNFCQFPPAGEPRKVLGADPQTRWPACGVWAPPACLLHSPSSSSGCIWVPDPLAGTFGGRWVPVESRRRGWGPLQHGLGSVAGTPPSPHLLVPEHLAKPNLETRKRLDLS